jgi:hypothetical protein
MAENQTQMIVDLRAEMTEMKAVRAGPSATLSL